MRDDILDRLRSDRLEDAPLRTETADEIERLRAELAVQGQYRFRAEETSKALKAENTRLREALEPFAAFTPYDWQHDTDEVRARVGDLRRARAAYNGEESK